MAFESEHVLVSETAFAVRDRIRDICAHLPEAREQIDGFGHTVFKVRDKSFVMMAEGMAGDGGRLFVKSDKETQQMLIEKGPYIRAPYIGQHGWVKIDNVDIEDWDELRELIVEGYLRAAPKTLARAYSKS
ncbi:MmcQ/YjbR family DNA-binding protein [Cohnella caldifontis]|uniref:MmcQ/YjbR family DNA-binding protein n=1 Tax=Cohnella caldifontis TaxID=3027471 RepID=UPI0023EC2B0F|nr:MmcQ/YjbR family DNA-binding protein [Cohnella sp. YIM B05605]